MTFGRSIIFAAVLVGAAGPASAAPMEWRHYTNHKLGYSISYPATWTLDTHYTFDALGPDRQIKGVSFAIPDSVEPGTNLSHNDTMLSVESLPGKDCKPSRFVDPAENVHKLKADGRVYWAATSEDAGAGNFRDTAIFVVDGAVPCIAVRYLVHSTNIGAYDPGTVKAFNERKLTSLFDAIRATLRLSR